MKTRLTLLLLAPVLLLLAAPSLRAQYVPEWYQGDLKKKGTKIAVSGEKLDRESTFLLLNDFGGEDLAHRWKTGTSLRNWGLGLTLGGATAMLAGTAFGGVYVLAGVVGTIFVAPFGQDAIDSLWEDVGEKASTGATISGIGLGSLVTGVVLMSVGNHKMRKIVRYCNENGQVREAELVFGPVAPDRAGLALRF